jgi:hypothetical protein
MSSRRNLAMVLLRKFYTRTKPEFSWAWGAREEVNCLEKQVPHELREFWNMVEEGFIAIHNLNRATSVHPDVDVPVG